MKPIIALLTLMAAAVAAIAADQVHWTNAVKVLGCSTDSDEFREITAAYGIPTRSQSGSSEEIGFNAVGIAFKTEAGRVVEVQLQIAPGKAIGDAGYSGGLPKNVEYAGSSPDDAVRILGEPLSDVKSEYRKLTYLIRSHLINA